MTVSRAIALVVAVLVVTVPAAAGSPGAWTRLPGTVINFAEPGLARTSDGVLHVVYVRKDGTKSELVHLTVSPVGNVGAHSVALGGWATMNHPDLLRMPDGSLRAFFGGIRSTSPGDDNDSMNTATAPASGSPWTLQEGRVVQSSSAYAGSTTGAGIARDGTPIVAWVSTGSLGFHYGTNPGDPDRTIPQTGCCLYTPDVAVDAVSGQAYIGFFSLEKQGGPGLFVNAIGPDGPRGGRKLAPGVVSGGNALQPGNRTSVTGRIGAPGVFAAYGQGYPTFKTLAVWRVDRAKPQLVLDAERAEHVNVAAAPDGRLWLMWGQSGTIYATRTNKAATRVGPATKLAPPGSGTIFRLNGEGSAGPLDLIANVQSGGQGLWHQQVLPVLKLTSSTRKTGTGRTIIFRVLDAGDPVAGATVKAGGTTLKTAANGAATLRQARSARAEATASKAGYVSASLSVR